MITNQVYNSGKHNKSLKGSRERGFTDVTKIPKITITAKITKITNLGSDIGKHDKSLKERRERGFTNVTKIPKTTLILDYIACSKRAAPKQTQTSIVILD